MTSCERKSSSVRRFLFSPPVGCDRLVPKLHLGTTLRLMTLHKPRLSDPRRLAGLILVVVAVFVVAVAGTLVAKSRTARVEATGGATSSADLRIKEVELEDRKSTRLNSSHVAIS